MGAGLPRAASFTVAPIQVYLSAKQANTLVTIRNDSDERMRFQVSAMAWAQTETGELQLTPTTDVVFFPRLLTLERGEQRNVRVGMVAPFAATEKTYRLFVEELPPPQDPSATNPTTVRMRTRMGIPVFATPAAPRAGAAVSALDVENGRVVLRVTNTGNIHVMPESIRVTGQGRDGGMAFDKTINSWYVLAGGAQRFEVALTDAECAAAAGVAATLQVDPTTRLTQTTMVAAGACRPAGAR